MIRKALLLPLAIALPLLVSCSAEPREKRPHIFVLLIDTLRADRVGCYDAGKGVSPTLDSLAARATVFWNAYAASSWTNPSIASLFTSRYPAQHGVHTFQSMLAPQERTLAEELRSAGYATAGFVANLLLHAGVGFSQGFDHYQIYFTGPVKERAQRLNGDALGWLDERLAAAPGTPVFAYLHYMEPHEPLQPASDVVKRLGQQRRWDSARLEALGQLARKAPPLQAMDAPMAGLAEDLYDAEVASIDADIGRFVAELDKRGVLADSVIVVTSDHGEEFFDHGSIGHGHTLYEELIRIPLLILAPGQSARHDVFAEVSLVDLMPTLLDLARTAPAPGLEGRSRSAWLDPPFLRRVWLRVMAYFRPGLAYSSLSDFGAEPQRPKTHAHAVVTGGAKVIEHRDGRLEGFDLRADPQEQKADSLRRSQRDRLAAALDELQTHLSADASPARTVPVDDETKERLRALGYDARQ